MQTNRLKDTWGECYFIYTSLKRRCSDRKSDCNNELLNEMVDGCVRNRRFERAFAILRFY